MWLPCITEQQWHYKVGTTLLENNTSSVRTSFKKFILTDSMIPLLDLTR